MPTRNARNGQLFTRARAWSTSAMPHTSRYRARSTRLRLLHLPELLARLPAPPRRCNEILGARLNTIHNLHYYLDLMRRIRAGDRGRAVRRVRGELPRRAGGTNPRTVGSSTGASGHNARRASCATPLAAGSTGVPLMDWLISERLGPGAPAAALRCGSSSQLLPLMLIFVVFYFLLIRPQQKRARSKAMVDELAAGDEVVTSGGILGKVTEIGDQFLTLEIADGVRVKVQRPRSPRCCPRARSRAPERGSSMNSYPVWKIHGSVALVLLLGAAVRLAELLRRRTGACRSPATIAAAIDAAARDGRGRRSSGEGIAVERVIPRRATGWCCASTTSTQQLHGTRRRCRRDARRAVPRRRCRMRRATPGWLRAHAA